MDEPLEYLKPGDRVHYVRDGSALARLPVAGENVARRGYFVEHIPRISRPDFSSLVFGTLPPDEVGYEDKVDRVIMPGIKQQFGLTRKVIKQARDDGLHEYTVVPHVPGVTYDPIDDFSDTRSQLPVPDSSERKTYSLQQFFFDSYVMEKFRLSRRSLETAKRLAVTNPTEAARYVQQLIRLDGFDQCVVNAGDYSRSKNRCIASLWDVARGFTPVETSIPATVVDKKIVFHDPYDVDQGWQIIGPVKYAPEIRALHNMICSRGPAEPMFLLGMELTILEIDIWDGKRYMSPTIVDHVAPDGILPRSSPVYSSFEESVSVQQREAIDRAKHRVMPVVASNGSVVASSVRLTDRHVLLNEHVVEKVRDATIGGDKFQMLRTVSRDLWVAKCVVLSDSEPWVLRKPRVGESAVLVYKAQNDTEVSTLVQVRSFDGVNVFTTLAEEARLGVSGAALVAVDDAALLGVYCGKTRDSCVCVHFGQVQYTDVVETDHQSEIARLNALTDDSGTTIYSVMKQRGLHRVVDAAIKSLVPLFSGGQHVGMAVNLRSKLITTVDPDDQQLDVGIGTSPLVFERLEPLQYVTSAASAIESAQPVVVRRPNPREKVFVVGRDSSSPYFTNYTNVVHVGVAARNFSLGELECGELPFEGGLVVSASDCAVVGQYVGVRASLSRGSTHYCSSLDLPQVTEYVGTLVDHLARKFPMLNPTSWPSEMVEEMAMHPSIHRFSTGESANAGHLPLASIGDCAAALALRTVMRQSGVPHATFSPNLQLYQSNDVMVDIAWKFGLPSFLKLGSGVSLPNKSKVYADFLEAIVGVAHLNETCDTFHQFCGALGLIPQDWLTQVN